MRAVEPRPALDSSPSIVGRVAFLGYLVERSVSRVGASFSPACFSVRLPSLPDIARYNASTTIAAAAAAVMKFTAALASLAFAGLAAAQFTKLPACAVSPARLRPHPSSPEATSRLHHHLHPCRLPLCIYKASG